LQGHKVFSLGLGAAAAAVVACGAWLALSSGDERALTPRFPPERIASVAPSTTELLFALGLANKVVGVSRACDYPAEVKSVAKVGNMGTPNIEATVRLRPDLVVSTPFERESAADRLRSLGIPVCIVPEGGFDEMYQAILEIGKATGAQSAADRLVASMKAGEREVAERVAAVPKEQWPRVFVEISYNPLYTIGRRSFVRDLVVRAGGRNVTDMLDKAYARVNPEFVVQQDPDVIVLGYMVGKDRPASGLAKRIGWGGLKAVKSGRVIADVHPDYMFRPGPRIITGLKMLADRLHPSARAPADRAVSPSAQERGTNEAP